MRHSSKETRPDFTKILCRTPQGLAAEFDVEGVR
jgi:hypothetical protein